MPGGDDILDDANTGWDVKRARAGVDGILKVASDGENILVNARNLAEGERAALERAGCACAWDASVYGTGAAARQQTLADVQTTAPAALARATNDAYAVMHRSGQDSRAYAQARDTYAGADRAYQDAQRRYHALPEEADAWATEAVLVGQWSAASVMRRVLPWLP